MNINDEARILELEVAALKRVLELEVAALKRILELEVAALKRNVRYGRRNK